MALVELGGERAKGDHGVGEAPARFDRDEERERGSVDRGEGEIIFGIDRHKVLRGELSIRAIVAHSIEFVSDPIIVIGANKNLHHFVTTHRDGPSGHGHSEPARVLKGIELGDRLRLWSKSQRRSNVGDQLLGDGNFVDAIFGERNANRVSDPIV